jgi:hypothetical protein
LKTKEEKKLYGIRQNNENDKEGLEFYE